MKRLFFSLLPLWLAALVSSAPAAARRPSSTSTQSKENQEQLLRWYESHTVGAYKKSAFTNAAWDQSAEQALELFARISADPEESTRTNLRSLRAALSRVVNAGCDDPLIRFVNWTYGTGDPAPTHEDIFDASVRIANRMEKSKYASPLKYAAVIRPWKLYVLYWPGNQSPSPALRQEAVKRYNAAYSLMLKTVKETNTPIEVVFPIVAEIEELLKGSKAGLKQFYDAVNLPLSKNWPESAYAPLFRGIFYIHYAWQERGTSVAANVPEESWKPFMDRLGLADDALWEAWKLDPTIERIPLEMMTLELGQGHGRERMELWFRRAMAINTNSETACSYKLHYLLPQWHGSVPDILAFGRECLDSTNWGPEVNWTMIRAHEKIANDVIRDPKLKESYWKEPLVWADVKATCEKNLRINSVGTNSARHASIFHADRCRQWDEVARHLRLLTSTNYNYFGGRTEFEKIARRASEKSARGEK